MRNLGHHLRVSDSALVGRDESGAIGAALHLSYESKDDLVVVTIKVGAVCLSYRRLEGRFAGDDLLRVGDEQARKKSAECGASRLLLVGYIHRENRASMYMAATAGMEPDDVPVDDYQAWIRKVTL